jgi:hypothetical protein
MGSVMREERPRVRPSVSLGYGLDLVELSGGAFGGSYTQELI